MRCGAHGGGAINLVSSAIDVALLPFAAIATTYLYFDLRVAKQQQGESAEAADVLPAETPPMPA